VRAALLFTVIIVMAATPYPLPSDGDVSAGRLLLSSTVPGDSSPQSAFAIENHGAAETAAQPHSAGTVDGCSRQTLLP